MEIHRSKMNRKAGTCVHQLFRRFFKLNFLLIKICSYLLLCIPFSFSFSRLASWVSSLHLPSFHSRESVSSPPRTSTPRVQYTPRFPDYVLPYLSKKNQVEPEVPEEEKSLDEVDFCIESHLKCILALFTFLYLVRTHIMTSSLNHRNKFLSLLKCAPQYFLFSSVQRSWFTVAWNLLTSQLKINFPKRKYL